MTPWREAVKWNKHANQVNTIVYVTFAKFIAFYEISSWQRGLRYSLAWILRRITSAFRTDPKPGISHALPLRVRLLTPSWGYRQELRERPGRRNRLFRQGRAHPLPEAWAGSRKGAARAQRRWLPFRYDRRGEAPRTEGRTHALSPLQAPPRQLPRISAVSSPRPKCCGPVSYRVWPPLPRWARGRRERARGETDSGQPTENGRGFRSV